MAAHGKGAARRNTAKKNKDKIKRSALNAVSRALSGDTTAPTRPFVVPTVTEDDLLAFQTSHFGDETEPDAWFVDAATALDYHPELDDEGGARLGFYDDGVKRTLTNEQIAMFRHSEIEQLVREGKLERADENDVQSDHSGKTAARANSPRPETSSITDEQFHLARPGTSEELPAREDRTSSPNPRSDVSHTKNHTRKQREQEVPYDERHKRKWEDFIEENDPVEGSLTHRRIVRQLDEHRIESVDLDY